MRHKRELLCLLFSLFFFSSCTVLSTSSTSDEHIPPLSLDTTKQPISSNDNLSSASSSSSGNEDDDKPFERGESGPVLVGEAYNLSDLPNAPSPYGPVPSNSQMKYYDEGISMFIHFGINTFTDAEWGNGTENPNDFQPTNLIEKICWVKLYLYI